MGQLLLVADRDTLLIASHVKCTLRRVDLLVLELLSPRVERVFKKLVRVWRLAPF